MKPVNSELVWLACAIDFEGSILMYPNWSPSGVSSSIRANTVVLTNTDLKLLRYARKLLSKYKVGNRLVPLSNSKRWSKKWNKAWRVEVSTIDDNKNFLPLVLPYLISKKKQCELVLKFLSGRDSRHNRHRETTVQDWKLMSQCQFLNKRGL
jgi:hypothetical protein